MAAGQDDMTFDLAEMRLQLEKGADIDETLDAFGHTALYLACEHGRVDDELGADVDRRSADGATPLFISCRNGHLGAATLCLNRGAAVDRAAEGGATPSRA